MLFVLQDAGGNYFAGYGLIGEGCRVTESAQQAVTFTGAVEDGTWTARQVGTRLGSESDIPQRAAMPPGEWIAKAVELRLI